MAKNSRSWHKFVGLSLSLCLLFCLLGTAFDTSVSLAASDLTTTNLNNATHSSSPGYIYYGATPVNSSSKPVLLFVHGYNSDSSVWYNGNDMFNYAYNNGFRAAAVDLYPGGSIWNNGQLLASLIQQICAHYGVSSLNIVAHSKGGVDTQAAVVFYGAGPYVQNVVTLDSPHYGTQLADLDYSSWAWWLGALVGQHSDATYDLQTSYMSYFRSVTDGNSNNQYIHLYTTAGTYNLWPLAYFFGGLYLDQYDSNDGVVPVYSTYNPEGTGIYSFNYNHNDVKLGHNSFNVIKPYISSTWRNNLPLRTINEAKPVVAAAKMPTPGSNQILRGGQLTTRTTQTESLVVEPGANNLKLELLTENAKLNVVAVGPKGERVPLQLQTTLPDTDHFFKGARQFAATLNQPTAGTWRIELDTRKSGSASYLLLADFQSKLKLNLTLGKGATTIFAPNSALSLNLNGVDAKGQPLRNLHVEGIALHNGDRANLNTDKSMTVHASGDTDIANTYQLPAQEGVYNLSLTVTGDTADGQAFERSLVTSVLVGSPSSLATHAKSLDGK